MMVKVKTYRKLNREPTYLQRFVKSYKRKSNNSPQQVKEYIQRYKSPRGRIGNVTSDNITKHSQTMWLMDKRGHFVGRANYGGKTRARNISKFGYDYTTVIRDAKRYKRVLGRTSE